MSRDKCVGGGPNPAHWRHTGEASEPPKLRQDSQQSQPRFESLEPRAIRRSNVHFVIKVGAGKGGLRCYGGIVVVQKSQPRAGIVRFNLLLGPTAERARAVHENVVSRILSHRQALT